jgi:filamentous hemagglutinin
MNLGSALLGTAVGTLAGGTQGAASGAVAAWNADVYNRQLHKDEKQRIQELAEGDAAKEARLTAAACALIQCYAEYPEGSLAYNEMKMLADIGASDALTNERALLQAQEGLFVYTTQGFFNDELTDSYKNINNSYQIIPRTLGGLEAVGGGLGLAAATGAAPFCTTGIGCLATTALGTLSADALIAGSRQMVSGQPESTMFNQALQGLGMSPEAAAYAEFILGIGAAAKVGNIIGVATSTQASLNAAARQSYEDIAKFGTKGINVTPDVMATPQAQAIVREYLAAGISPDQAQRYARDLLKTGSDIPIPMIFGKDEELIKLVPKTVLGSDGVSSTTPFFVTRQEYEGLLGLSSGQIAQKLGLPAEQSIRGTQLGFDVYSITPKSGTSPTVFSSTVASIEQGTYTATGGAQQVLVPNRSLWTDPVKIESIAGGAR